MRIRTAIIFTTLAWTFAACGAEDPGLIHELGSVESAADEWVDSPLSPTIASPHPYTNNAQIERRVEGPSDALALRLLVDVRTEQNYDSVTFSTESGELIQTFTGQGQGYTVEIPGRVAIVRLSSDVSITDWGFEIKAIRYKRNTGGTGGTGGQWVDVSTSYIGTPSPYANNQDQRWELSGPSGTAKMRVSFRRFDTESGYDFVSLSDGQGNPVARYDGSRGAFTSTEINDSKVVIRFTSDGSVTKSGFDVSKVEAFVSGGGGGNNGCQSDRDCPSGNTCQPVQCVRAPCPNLCMPPQGNNGGAVGEACDARSAPCQSGLLCAPEQNSSLGGVCAAPSWSAYDLPTPISTAHPYGHNRGDRFEILGPNWAEQIKIVFSGFALERGYDFVTIEGSSARLTGALGDFESDPVDGHRTTIELESDYSVDAYGFDVYGVQAFGVPDRLVAVSLDPLQCNSDRIPTDTASLTQYLAARGVQLYGVHRYQFSTNVCRACSCATGERVVLLVESKDVYETLNLTRNTGIFSIQAWDTVHSGRLALMGVAPKQCGNNAWERYCDQNGCGSQSIDHQVAAWAASLGIDIYAVHETETGQAVCSGCSCPTGRELFVGVPTQDTGALEAQGFTAYR